MSSNGGGVGPAAGSVGAPPAAEPSSPLRGKQQSRRQRIVDAAYTAILENDEENIHIRDIAALADVALGTAYRYFQSKDRLLAEAYEKWVNIRYEDIATAARQASTNTERLRLVAFELLDEVYLYPQFARIARQMLRATDDPVVVEVVRRCDEKAMLLCRSALEGIEQRDVDAIGLLIQSWLYTAADRMTMGLISRELARQLLAKAVRIVLEFRDPTLVAAIAEDESNGQHSQGA